MCSYQNAEEFAADQPYISPSIARKILARHGQDLREFMGDTEFMAERCKAEPRQSRSTEYNINTLDLIMWLGY